MLGVQAGYHEGVGKTPFLAQVVPEACNGCGLCFSACNVNAIFPSVDVKGAKKSSGAQIDESVCLGCGACIPVCRRQALTLVERPERPLPPEKRKDMFKAILKEKKRMTPYVVSGVKKKLRKILPG
jgi:ferredoxin